MDIQNKFPEKKFKEYLKKLGFTSTDEMSSNTITQAFILMIHDFNKGIISLDELSPMAEQLSNKLAMIDNEYYSETGRILEKSIYLYHDLRTIQDETNADIFIDKLKHVLDFYDKYKYIIESFISN